MKKIFFFYLVIFFVNKIYSTENTKIYEKENNEDEIINVTQQEKLNELTVTFNKIESNNKWIESLSNVIAEEGFEMPMGMRKKFGENTMAEIAFCNMTIEENYTKYTVYTKIILPSEDDNNQKRILFFGGDNLKFNNETNNFEKGSTLYLLKDIKIPISEDISLIFKGGEINTTNGTIENKSTYATLNCNGIETINIEGIVSISENIVTLLDDNLNPLYNKNLEIGFSTKIKKWEDIIIEINDKRLNFEIKKLKDYKFSVENIVLDFSSITTSKSIKLPNIYKEKDLYQGDEFNSWEGVYIKNIVLGMPKYFHKESSNIKVSELIFDRHGISGGFSGINILDYGDIEGEGCNYSLDTIDVMIECNNITKFKVGGKIKVPALENPSNYVVSIEDDNYLVRASITKEQKMPLFVADIHLDPTSTIEILIESNKFKPSVTLNGYMSISEEIGANIPNIIFRELKISPTDNEKISVKEFGIKEQARLFNLPLIIKEINLNTTQKNNPKLYFDIEVEITEQVSAGGGMSIVGEIPENKGLEEWRYKNFEVNKIYVDASISGGIVIKGYLETKRGDQLYGDYFKGNVKADFNGIGVEVEALFGAVNKEDEKFNYFYLDGLVNLGRIGVPVAGVLQLNGFGGGAWKNMKKKGLGQSPTGQKFEPCKSVSLGVRATVSYSLIGSPELLNGKAGFEMEFLKTGGIKRTGFYGEAKMVDFSSFPLVEELKNDLNIVEKNIEKTSIHFEEMGLEEKSKQIFPSKVKGESVLSCFFSLEYNFEARTFDGNIETYMNVANILVGSGPENRVAFTHLHFSETKWYIHLGTPTSKCGINLQIGKYKLAQLEMYFMTGTNIPELPPIPTHISNKLGFISRSIDNERLNNGKGIIFGTNLTINTDRLRFLCFYADFRFDLGWDLLIKEYKNVSCKGSSSELGIGGWYSKGQVYSYVEAGLGIQVRIWGFRGEYEIFRISLAALLQAELPNPIWIRGAVGGDYRILGGLVRGSCNFKFELGERCEMVGNTMLDGMPVIQEIKPDAEEEVDVFSSVQVLFNFPINEEFKFKDDNGERTYKIELSTIDVNSEKEGKVLGKYTFNSKGDLMTFIADDGFLPKSQKIEIITKVIFKRKANGRWIEERNQETGGLLEEIKKVSFTTGKGPEKIDYSTLVYTYPVINQKNFHKKEYEKGYFLTKTNIEKLLLKDFREKGDDIKVRLLSEDGSFKKDISYTLIENDKGIEYILPIEEMSNEKKYKITMVSIPKKEEKSNIKEEIKKVNDQGTGNSMEIVTKKLEGNISNGEEHILLDEYIFRISKYNTFEEKVSSIRKTGNTYQQIQYDNYILGADITSEETFENVELKGDLYTNSKPMIDIESTMEDYYLKNKISFLYKNYPIRNSIYITNRDVNKYGLIPKKAIYFNLDYINQDAEHIRRRIFPYKYALHKYYKGDYVEIRERATNLFYNNDAMKKEYSELLNSRFPFMSNGIYQVKMGYVLPGIRQGSIGYFNFESKLQ